LNAWLRNILLSVIIVSALLYSLIAALQSADSATIGVAKEVDAFIVQYCDNERSLPTKAVLESQFPNQNTDAGWFFHTDNRTFLIVQYPMKWWNNKAIGKGKISEFTGTVYAYAVDYRCSKPE